MSVNSVNPRGTCGGGRLCHARNWVVLRSDALCISSLLGWGADGALRLRPWIRRLPARPQQLAFAWHRAWRRAPALGSVDTVEASQEGQAPLTDEHSALDSPCSGLLVARLDNVTTRDLLGEAQVGRSPNTIGEFIAPHEAALV